MTKKKCVSRLVLECVYSKSFTRNGCHDSGICDRGWMKTMRETAMMREDVIMFTEVPNVRGRKIYIDVK